MKVKRSLGGVWKGKKLGRTNWTIGSEIFVNTFD